MTFISEGPVYRLRIELLSPLCSSSGRDMPGVVDRDVVFDETGLPWLPGRRLKGLLRDAYSTVVDGIAGLTDAGALPPVERLFGQIGDSDSGLVSLRSAFLHDHDSLHRWLTAWLDPRGRTALAFAQAEVVAAFCETRRQTAMDRKEGVPLKETLRATRTLRSGLVFEAELAGDLGVNALCALGLAAAALREMGASRWRGLGRVSCSVIEDGPPERDWTATALAAISVKGFELPSAEVTAPGHSTANVPDRSDGALRFELTTRDEAVFPALRGDPNTVTSSGYIPGSAIHGWFARRMLGAPEFRACFTSGDVRFHNAYPARDGVRLAPAPTAVRGSKDDRNKLYDLTRQDAELGLTRIRRWADTELLINSGALRTAETVSTLHYHHARAGNPMLQRAIGVEEAPKFNLGPNEAGALFQYSALAAGQKFIGQISGPPALLTRIRELAAEGESLRLGRSRSAQYGAQATIRWLSPLTSPERTANKPVTAFTVLLISPLLGYNDRGHPSPCFPVKELQRALGEGVALKVEKEYVRVEWHGAYLSHQRLPRQQLPALAAGGVIVFSVVEGEVRPDVLATAGQRGYGQRREHGFGEVRIVPRSNLTNGLNEEEWLVSTVRPVTPGPGSPEAELALRLFKERLLGMARSRAGDEARLMTRRHPPKHLAHRLRLMLGARDEVAFQQSLGKLRTRAKGSLEAARLIGRRQTMLEFLRTGWKEIHEALVNEVLNAGYREVLGSLTVPFDAGIARLYLAEYLANAAKFSDKKGGPK